MEKRRLSLPNGSDVSRPALETIEPAKGGEDTYQILSPRYTREKAKSKKKKPQEKHRDDEVTPSTDKEGPELDVATPVPSPAPALHVVDEESAKEEEKGKPTEGPPRLLRRHTLGLSRRWTAVNAVEVKEVRKEGDLVWRKSRKESQSVTLSLTPSILWIKKANKDDFSPFLEVINISNVYMKKGVETVFPPRRSDKKEAQDEKGAGPDDPKESKESTNDHHHHLHHHHHQPQLPRHSMDEVVTHPSKSLNRRNSWITDDDGRPSTDGEKQQKEGESEASASAAAEAKSTGKPSGRIGSMIAGWPGVRGSIIGGRTGGASTKGPQPTIYYSFVVEVRRKEFTTDVITQVFASEEKSEVESWVTALHAVIIAARTERRKTLALKTQEESSSDGSAASKEKREDQNKAEQENEPRPSSPPPTPPADQTVEPTYETDLLTGLSSVIPGETEKQRHRRLKREMKEELQERKRQGKAEAKLSLFELVTTKGYPIEEHKVTAPDGYIVTLHRIPYSQNETGYSPRPVVFLMHGLMDCSVTWIINEARKSLGFIFADSGFDVWMGNSRGNRYSREHAHLKVDSTQYWNFNRDDLIKDVRSSIEYVLQSTSQPHLVYIGHSQGTNVMFAMMASQPDIKSKISIFMALAPAVYVHNQKSKMMTYLANMQTDKLFQFMGIKAFLATGSWVNNIVPGFLIYSAQGSRFVTRLVFDSMCGWNPDNNFSLDRLPVIAAHQPGGTSVMVMAHWAQSIRNDTFSKFDFGAKKNMEVYGQEQPPTYDLGAIDDARVAIFYGGEDKLTCKEDVERLISELPKESVVYVQYEEEYGHLDFVWGDDAHIRVYSKMVQLAKEYYQLAEKRREREENEQQDKNNNAQESEGEGDSDSERATDSSSSGRGTAQDDERREKEEKGMARESTKERKKDKLKEKTKKTAEGKKKTKSKDKLKRRKRANLGEVNVESNGDLHRPGTLLPESAGKQSTEETLAEA